jgi:hypothetical protein
MLLSPRRYWQGTTGTGIGWRHLARVKRAA